MKVGRTTARFSTNLSTRPSMALANPTASWAARRTLPKEWAKGSHRYCTSSSFKRPSSATAAPS